jgi:hypothetical protein
MISNLFWMITAPFVLAFIVGFITYNLGEVPTTGENQKE